MRAFDFPINSAGKIHFTLYSNYDQIGVAEVSLNSNRRAVQLFADSREVGVLHYKLALGKLDQEGKGYLKHNKNVESEHYNKEVMKKERDKSSDVNRHQNFPTKKIVVKDNPPTKISKEISGSKARIGRGEGQAELPSNYFRKKSEDKRHKAQVYTESNESDRRSQQASKFLLLQNQLKELIDRRHQISTSRKSVQIKLDFHREAKSSIPKSSPLQELRRLERVSLIQSIKEVTVYNDYLKDRIHKLQAESPQI